MKAPDKPIDLKSMARIIEVDNRIPLHYYYRIADNLLKQACIYREEKNILDLYIILLRYTSLVTETIPWHRDYQVSASRQKISSKKNAVAVIEELEFIKPEALRRVEELNNAYAITQQFQLDGPESDDFGLGTSSLEWSSNTTKTVSSQAPATALQSSWKYNNGHTQASLSNAPRIDNQLQRLSLSRPPPNKETLSRHSFLGPNGFSRWTGPSTEVKVQYPSSSELNLMEDSRLIQAGQCDNVSVDGAYSGGSISPMESVLSLDDCRWFRPAEEASVSMGNIGREHHFQLPSVRQPSPPPVLAEMKQEYCPIPPSKVADPRPGVAKASQDGISSSNSYQHLHIPVKMMDDFLRLARENTKKNLETCGVLAGSLKNRVFHITTLIIPKQEATSDSCQTLNEEEIFDVQDKLSLFPLGWIHTHPSQTCFMSSVDLHTHYSYQIMLPEAIAIVMAPTDVSSPHGIFHLSDPSGVTLIRNCQQRGFHPHEEPADGSPIYEHCSHVYMNPKLRFEVVDLR